MGRPARAVAPDCAHHVTQRGNNGQTIFFNPADRRRYLRLLAEHSERERLDILGYCLMTNHVHLVVIPQTPEALARTLRRAHAEYAQETNHYQDRRGHLFQNRFYSCVMDRLHQWRALRYVEQNPARAGLVPHAADWIWSSAREHLQLGGNSELRLRMGEWNDAFGPELWRDLLAAGEDAGFAELRSATRRGWAVGSVEFCERVAAAVGRRVLPYPVGRPRNISRVA